MRSSSIVSLVVAITAGLTVSGRAAAPLPPIIAPRTFTNPILPEGNDPWVIRHGDNYYYCGSIGGALFVGKSDTLQTIGAGIRNVWIPPRGKPYSRSLWAPELHYLRGHWYIYVAADDGKNETHQMYVLRAVTDDPRGAYALLGALDTGVDTRRGHEKRWAIDGTVLKLDGKLYFIWSGWHGTENVAQNLYIAPMSGPSEISGPRVLISRPEYPWEKKGRPLVNEGPTVLQRDGRTFVIYSASGSWTDDYCLGRLTLVGRDPLAPTNWIKHPEPVFQRAPGIFGPGHASFVNDGRRDWVVYHTARYSGAGWDREVRIQPFDWDTNGAPIFGSPVPTGQAIPY